MPAENGPVGVAKTSRKGLVGQAALVVMGAALAVAPPANGPILILPLWPTSTAATLRWAFVGDARLVGPGPFAGSVVVSAPRDMLFTAAVRHGALLINARAVPCGAGLETSR